MNLRSDSVAPSFFNSTPLSFYLLSHIFHMADDNNKAGKLPSEILEKVFRPSTLDKPSRMLLSFASRVTTLL